MGRDETEGRGNLENRPGGQGLLGGRAGSDDNREFQAY
jgi:hypothetical protein